MTSKLKATLIQHVGTDAMVADAARVSTDNDRQDKPIAGLIKYLAREGHTSPFEHNSITFMIEAPLFVRDQWVRHRTQSYNCLSLRYSGLKDLSEIHPSSIQVRAGEMFYIPPRNRPLVNSGSGAHPKFDKIPNEDEYSIVFEESLAAYVSAILAYRRMIEAGIAEEVARNVLPSATMTRFYATANLLNWNRFVTERTADNAQWEIKQIALQLDDILKTLFPIAWPALRGLDDEVSSKN